MNMLTAGSEARVLQVLIMIPLRVLSLDFPSHGNIQTLGLNSFRSLGLEVNGHGNLGIWSKWAAEPMFLEICCMYVLRMIRT